MKENKKEQSKINKDYYSSVLFSQLLCCGLIVAIFFCVRASSHWQGLKEDYTYLLKEDFFSKEFASAVSTLTDYISNEKSSYAVFNNRVEPYSETTETVTEKTTETTSSASPAEAFTNFKADKVSEMGLKYEKESLTDSSRDGENIIFPLNEGRYTSLFGERTDPISEGEDYHKGVDIGADEGDKIKAAFDGRVSSVGYDSRSGNYIFLTHDNGYVTFYCHCSEILAKEGSVIRQGETIALVGSTGYATGPHLHFEIRVDGESIDPVPLLENAS